MTARLDQSIPDFAQIGRRHTGNDGPVNLAGLAVAHRRSQRLGGCTCPRQKQNPGRVLVQPMYKPWFFFEIKFQRLRKRIHMALALPRSPLNRQTGRLVQCNHLIVTVDHAGPDELHIRVADPALFIWRRCCPIRQGRDAHLLAGFNAR